MRGGWHRLGVEGQRKMDAMPGDAELVLGAKENRSSLVVKSV